MIFRLGENMKMLLRYWPDIVAWLQMYIILAMSLISMQINLFNPKTQSHLWIFSFLPLVKFRLHCSDSVHHAHTLLWLGFCVPHWSISILHAAKLLIGCSSTLYRSGVPLLSSSTMHLHKIDTNSPRMGE